MNGRTMSDTLDEASARTGATTERLAGRAHDAIDQVSSAVQNAADRMSAKGDEWMQRQDEMMQQMRGYVRERPVMAIGIALAVGFLLSRLAR